MKKITFLLSLLLVLIVTACEADKVVYDTASKADFTIGEELYELGTPAAFTDASVPDVNNTIVSWLWEFGDDNHSTSTEQNPTFTYKTDGAFTVSLTVTDSNGLKSKAQKDLTILDPTKAINIMWQREIGGKINNSVSPVLSADGKAVYMYANAASGKEALLMAYDVASGNLNWSFDISKSMKENHDEGSTKAGVSDIFCSPSVGSNGDIYFAIRDLKDKGAARRLFMFAVKSNGMLNWADAAPDANIYGVTPAIDAKGNIYLGNRGEQIRIYSAAGEVLKTLALDNQVVSGISLSKDGTLYFGSNPTGIFAYTYETGVQKFASSFGGSGLKANSYTIDAKGTIYTATSLDANSGIIAVNSDGTTQWIYKTPGDISDGGVALGADGTIYATGGKVVEGLTSGGIVALNADGTLKWHFGTKEDVSGTVPLVDNRGYIHFVSDKAIYYIVKPDGTLFSSAELGVKSVSSPIMDAKGNFYISVETTAGVSEMFCITSGAKSYAINSVWPMRGQNPQRTGLQK